MLRPILDKTIIRFEIVIIEKPFISRKIVAKGEKSDAHPALGAKTIAKK